MAQFSVHLGKQSVSCDYCGLHNEGREGPASGWIALQVGNDRVVMHACDVMSLASQLEVAANNARAQLAEEVRRRDFPTAD